MQQSRRVEEGPPASNAAADAHTGTADRRWQGAIAPEGSGQHFISGPRAAVGSMYLALDIGKAANMDDSMDFVHRAAAQPGVHHMTQQHLPGCTVPHAAPAPQPTPPIAPTSISSPRFMSPRLRWAPELHNAFLTAVAEVRCRRSAPAG